MDATLMQWTLAVHFDKKIFMQFIQCKVAGSSTWQDFKILSLAFRAVSSAVVTCSCWKQRWENQFCCSCEWTKKETKLMIQQSHQWQCSWLTETQAKLLVMRSHFFLFPPAGQHFLWHNLPSDDVTLSFSCISCSWQFILNPLSSFLSLSMLLFSCVCLLALRWWEHSYKKGSRFVSAAAQNVRCADFAKTSFSRILLWILLLDVTSLSYSLQLLALASTLFALILLLFVVLCVGWSSAARCWLSVPLNSNWHKRLAVCRELNSGANRHCIKGYPQSHTWPGIWVRNQWEKQSVTSPKNCHEKMKQTSNAAQTWSNLECSQHHLALWTKVMCVMVTGTLRKKGLPLVDVNQPDWQIWQHSGKPNAAAHTGMMEQQCSTTNFPAMTCSNGEPNSKTQQTNWWAETACNSLAACGWISQEERCQQHGTTLSHLLKQRTSFHAWTLNLSGQPMETCNSGCISNHSNQHLKCLNTDSINTETCFKVVPLGVHKWLSELTTILETNKNLPPDKVCPQHKGSITKKSNNKQQHWLNICNTSKMPKHSDKLRSGQFQWQMQQKENNLLLCWTFWHLVQSSNLSKTNLISHGWECLCLATDS